MNNIPSMAFGYALDQLEEKLAIFKNIIEICGSNLNSNCDSFTRITKGIEIFKSKNLKSYEDILKSYNASKTVYFESNDKLQEVEKQLLAAVITSSLIANFDKKHSSNENKHSKLKEKLIQSEIAYIDNLVHMLLPIRRNSLKALSTTALILIICLSATMRELLKVMRRSEIL